ncbi:MAG TPA: glycosyltransferase family 4 protein [Bryobacteraceae bacterium]|nr:glycosyltransferase family 4 protein [Bryobacteraceae bacterium]
MSRQSPGHTRTVVSVFGVDPYRIGAGEIYARELSRQLGERGWKSVLCYLAPPPGSVRKFLALPNVSFEVFEDSWKLNRKSTRRGFELLRQYRPEILHLYFTGFLSLYPWMARIESARQVFFTDQSSRPEGYVPKRYPMWRRLLMRGIHYPLNKVICVSNYGERCFTAMDLLPRERFVTIYNSVDLARAAEGLCNRSAFRSKYKIADDRLVVAQVSSLIPEKGITDLLQAARVVAAQEPRAHFVLAGSGTHAAEYQAMSGQLGLTDRVTFTGVLEDPLAQGAYGAADVVCQVSRWEEVFGYVIAEAMASGLPVVGTRVGGIPELIEDGKTGYLVTSGDVPRIADRVLALLRNGTLRQTMGQAGREAAEKKFDHRKNVAQVLELYDLS